jgi:hypothetical protein
MTTMSEDQQLFCARWLERQGIHDHPTLQQLMEMAEAWAAHRLRSRTRSEPGPGDVATSAEVAGPAAARVDGGSPGGYLKPSAGAGSVSGRSDKNDSH